MAGASVAGEATLSLREARERRNCQCPVPASRRDAAVIAAVTNAVTRYLRCDFWSSIGRRWKAVRGITCCNRRDTQTDREVLMEQYEGLDVSQK